MDHVAFITAGDENFDRALEVEFRRHGYLLLPIDSTASSALLELDRLAAAVVVGYSGRSDRGGYQIISAVRRGRPEIPIVVCVDSQALGRVGLGRIARSGADDVFVMQNRDGAAEFVRFVIRAAKHRLSRDLVQELVEAVPGEVRHVVSWTLRRAWHEVSVQDFEFFDVDRKTVYRRLVRAHAPTTRTLIMLCRLAYVCVELDRSSGTESVVAERLNFPSDSSLRMLVYRAFHESVTNLRGEAVHRLRARWLSMFPRR